MVASDGRTRPERTFTDLVWPAAAGNVVWSVVTIAVQALTGVWQETLWQVGARLFTLLLLAWYLHSEWIFLAEQESRLRLGRTGPLYWLGDGLLVLGIVCLALALAVNPSSRLLPYVVLSAVYAVALAWHSLGWWRESRFHVRIAKAGVNALGLALLWIGYLNVPAIGQLVPLIISLAVVLLAWSIWISRFDEDLPKQPRVQRP